MPHARRTQVESAQMGMMYYPKKHKRIQFRRIRAPLSRFAGIDADKTSTTLPCDWTACCYNFGFRNGRLVPGVGISELKIVSPIDGTARRIPTMPLCKERRTLFVAKNDDRSRNYTTLVVSDENGLETLAAGEGENWRHAVCDQRIRQATTYRHKDRDLLLMTGAFDGILIRDGDEIRAVADALRVCSLCVHEERVFAVAQGKRNALWYSSAFDPYNWNVSAQEGGYIEFDGTLGEVNVVKSLGDYLYIFCDYGIYRLSVYAEQSQFALKKIYSACDRIYAGSIVECKDAIAFATARGIYLFDGYDAAKFAFCAEDIPIEEGATIDGAYADERYYLSISDTRAQTCEYGALDREPGKYVLLAVDLPSRTMSMLRGVRLHSLQTMMTPCQSCAVGISDDTDSVVTLDDGGAYLGKTPVRLWKAKGIDFGQSAQVKIVRRIEYSTRSQYVLGIVADGQTHEFVLSPKRNEVSTAVRGREFDFYIRSDAADAEIAPPYLTVDIMER